MGYRVNSKKATMFRIWANRVLKEFIIKGYVMDDARLREPDRIHLSNGTLFLDGTFAKGKPKIVRNRFPVSYKPNAPKPVLWLQFLDGLLYPEDIPTLQEYIGCLSFDGII